MRVVLVPNPRQHFVSVFGFVLSNKCEVGYSLLFGLQFHLHPTILIFSYVFICCISFLEVVSVSGFFLIFNWVFLLLTVLHMFWITILFQCLWTFYLTRERDLLCTGSLVIAPNSWLWQKLETQSRSPIWEARIWPPMVCLNRHLDYREEPGFKLTHSEKIRYKCPINIFVILWNSHLSVVVFTNALLPVWLVFSCPRCCLLQSRNFKFQWSLAYPFFH